MSGAETAVTTVTERPAAATVLVVDDEEAACLLCCDVAAELGLHARSAATTEKALELLDQYPVDIILTDLKVPALGGSNCSGESGRAIRWSP